MNIIEEIQKRTGHATVQKVDPNTQTPDAELHDDTSELLSQAAIPAAFIGLYKYTRNDDLAVNLLNGQLMSGSNFADAMFGDRAYGLINSIANYAHVSTSRAEAAVNDAAAFTVELAKENVGSNATTTDIGSFFQTHHNEVLKHLPPALQLGKLLDDNTLDDRTHKMEGPLSGLMHSIENLFSDSSANDSTKQ